MIAEIFAGLAVAGAGAAVWGWRAASVAKDRVLVELEWRRKGEAAAADLARVTRGERDVLSGHLVTVTAQLTQSAIDAAKLRAERDFATRRLQELYAIIKRSGLPGGRERVVQLMQEAIAAGALPLPDRDPDAG